MAGIVSFRYKNLAQIGYNYPDKPACYSYQTTDTLSQVIASGYFNDSRAQLREGDFIFLNCSDATQLLSVTSSTSAEISENNSFGWADYADTTYTSGSPLAVLADTDTVLPNDGLGGNQSQEPPGVTMYDGSVITGRNGDGLLFTLEMKVVPTNGAATYIEVWIDIGGAVGELYRRIATFPKGQDVERTITLTTAGYTLDTWEQNGATVYVRCNGTCNIYDIRYILTRTHKAR